MSFFGMGGGGGGAKPKPAPYTPTRADASSFIAGTSTGALPADKSLITTGSLGLKRKASTEKKSLIGATGG